MAQLNKEEENQVNDELSNLTTSHPPAPTYARKHLYVDPDVPEKSTTSLTYQRRDLAQSEQISGSSHPDHPAAPLLLHTPLAFPDSRMSDPSLIGGTAPGVNTNTVQPRTRHRTRKVVTDEIIPTDSESVAVLGMSPFMPNKDAIYNQNRLVRNEVILARHLSRLQKNYYASESAHAQRAQDFYRVLTDHKNSIDLLKSNNQSSSSVNLQPEFTALVEAHNETRKALDELTKDIASFSSTTRESIAFLADSVRRLTSPFPESSESAIAGLHPDHTIMAPPHSLTSSPSLFERPFIPGTKRRRSSDEFLNTDVPPTSRPSTSAAHSALQSRSNSIHEYQREVVYGPISSAADLSDPVAVGHDAVRNVGLSTSMVHSIRIIPGRPEYLSVRFLKPEYAARFVDLVPFGDHPERQALVADDQIH
ncbi:hypothetical protein JR316_0009658 [Psilocybe cubensis]|uniref:Uncharacterized protein n=2 Tax=Psilocybe cubensis TaxID=181762 RepID=A0A8H7XN72_PSICU|nr:hypothetical protein JR316_0009658 [Psilocybe cubensis]KAH9477445.1 hypothetical protein JR316_0009658 [Psilocybe cubensis]